MESTSQPMTEPIVVYTRTMAKVYCDQGHFEKSAEIYRKLIAKEPGRKDLIEELQAVEEKLRELPKHTFSDVLPLFQEWIQLAMHYNRLKKLKALHR